MKKCIVGAILLVLFHVSFSQQTSKAITLDEVITIALEHNIAVIQAGNTLEAQESNRLAAYGDFFPSLSLSGGWTRSQSTGTVYFQGVPIPGVTTLYNSFSSGLSANMTLFNGFANTANLNRAQSNVAAAENTLYRTRQQKVYETTQLYLNVLRTRELLKVSEENLKRSQKQLERIQESNRVGALSLADVYRQQVQVGSDELALIQAQSNYDKAKADLAFFLALDVMEDYDFSDPAMSSEVDKNEFKEVEERYGNFYALVNEAMKVRPDYLSAAETYNSASSGVAVARAGHFPTVSAFASYGYASDTLSRITDNRSVRWGLQISLPLFSGFTIDNQWQQARINERNAYEQLKQAERQVQVDIRKALLDYEAAKKQIDVTQKSVISAEQDRRIAEEKYNLGAGTLLDLLIANANYVSALSNKVNALYNYKLVKKQLEFATGTLTY
jgi:outer membrane protein